MKRIAKVMVACDFSPYSVPAIQYGIEFAKNFRAILAIVHVVNQRAVDLTVESLNRSAIVSHDLSVSMDAYVNKLKKDRSQQIKALMDGEVGSRLPFRAIVKLGDPWQEIIRSVKEEKADLLIIGAKGRSLAVGFFGSTAEKLFRHCPVPLVSIRLPAEGRQAELPD